MKYRVFEVAKHLGLETADIEATCGELGIKLSAKHLTQLSDGDVRSILRSFGVDDSLPLRRANEMKVVLPPSVEAARMLRAEAEQMRKARDLERTRLRESELEESTLRYSSPPAEWRARRSPVEGVIRKSGPKTLRQVAIQEGREFRSVRSLAEALGLSVDLDAHLSAGEIEMIVARLRGEVERRALSMGYEGGVQKSAARIANSFAGDGGGKESGGTDERLAPDTHSAVKPESNEGVAVGDPAAVEVRQSESRAVSPRAGKAKETSEGRSAESDGSGEGGGHFFGYRLLEKIEDGGMANAWVALDPNGKKVFLKRAFASGTNGAALEREQQIYERLMRGDYPHMVSVIEYRRDAHFAALVCEFADGGSLANFIEQNGGLLSKVELRSVALRVSQALAALHRDGVVHRDIKPANILRIRDDWVLADFGIAKSTSRLVSLRTFQGQGTLGYAAPEQIDGAEAHPSADVYSFGKVVCFGLTGTTDPDVITDRTWKQFIRECVRERPEERLKSSDLESRLHGLR